MQEIPKEQIRALAQKMLAGTITPEEQQLLEQWLNTNPGNELVWEQGDANETELGNRIFRRIVADTGAKKRKRMYWTAAASVLLLVSITIYILYPNRKPVAKEVAKAVVSPAEIKPGSDKAILTLGDGRQVALEGQKIISDGDLQIRNENNELVYAKTSIVSLNTMSTPRGGQYQLRLPDGSRVWLNASSSITYPTAFTGNERVVQLSGEAYFEVSPLPASGLSPNPSGGEDVGKMPFIVKINGMNVNVLGTHFNVMGYDDEAAIKTTLLEGAVQITKGNAKELLKPGQEANVNTAEEKIKIAAANIEQAVAWKNGMFLFNKTDIKSIMRQLSRWYDFEVRYENLFKNRNFSGLISRKTELSKVLKMLEMTKDIKFKIEGRIVTVI